MKEINETIEIGQEIYGYVVGALQNEQGVHVETLVAALARLSGTCLLRSCEILPPDSKPGQPILSDAVNAEGGQLQGLVFRALQAFGVGLDQEKIVMDTPERHKPQLDVLGTQRLLQAGVYEITNRNTCDEKEAAYAAAVASAIAINATQAVLDPHVTFGIAAYGIVEGAKTVPLPLNS